MNTIFEQMGGTYCEESGYLIPDLLPPASNTSVGIWGQRRRSYLKQHRKPIYTGLLLSGKLNAHLAEVDQVASEMYERLMEQMAQVEGVGKKLKATDQMAWVGRMNNISNQVAGIVLNELIYD